jgi:hypothetical protein
MRKKLHALRLSRETVRNLQGSDLSALVGGATNVATECVGCRPTMHPANCPHSYFCNPDSFFCGTDTGGCV